MDAMLFLSNADLTRILVDGVNVKPFQLHDRLESMFNSLSLQIVIRKKYY
jgi:hypothetical protein